MKSSPVWLVRESVETPQKVSQAPCCTRVPPVAARFVNGEGGAILCRFQVQVSVLSCYQLGRGGRGCQAQLGTLRSKYSWERVQLAHQPWYSFRAWALLPGRRSGGARRPRSDNFRGPCRPPGPPRRAGPGTRPGGWPPGGPGPPGSPLRLCWAAAAVEAAAGRGLLSPGSISRMMARGSSVRGLSLVTMTSCEPAAAARPMRGRLLRSRSPPQPNTVMSREKSRVLQGRQGLGDGRRGMGVIHEHAGACRRPEALQPARHAGRAPRCPGPRSSGLNAQPQGRGRGRQDIGQVERPHQAGGDLHFPRRGGETGLKAVLAEVVAQGPHLAVRMAGRR